MTDRDIRGFHQLPDKERLTIFYLAVVMELHHLPQLKGKGKLIDTRKREEGIHAFSNAVAEYVCGPNTNAVLLHGPPRIGWSSRSVSNEQILAKEAMDKILRDDPTKY